MHFTFQIIFHIIIFPSNSCQAAAAAAAKSLQAPPSLGFSRQEHWSGLPFPSAWKWKVKMKSLSGVWPLATPWTAAYQAPLSMEVSRQEYQSGVPLARCQQLKDKLNRNIYLFTLSTKQFGNIDICQPTNSTSGNSFQGSSEKLLIWTWYCIGKEKMNSWQR